MTNNSKKRDLKASQLSALNHVRKLSEENTEAAAYIRAITGKYNISAKLQDAAFRFFKTGTQIAVHFHPDRLTRNGKNVVSGMVEAGRYLSQYETGISNGSPTAHAGGERDEWEFNLFGGNYHGARSDIKNRPKYGSLEIFPYPDGPSPRFGSCYFVLSNEMFDRSTFTFGGSQESAALQQTGTHANFLPVFAAALEVIDRTGSIFGKSGLDIPAYFEMLSMIEPINPDLLGTLPLGRALDSFIEVQIHGDIDFAYDIKYMVCDSSYLDTTIGNQLTSLSSAYGFPVYWHSGFKMPVKKIPEFFRGYEIRSIAERISKGSMLDPAILGLGANSLILNPESWSGWGNEEDLITRFRRLWHAMVVYDTE